MLQNSVYCLFLHSGYRTLVNCFSLHTSYTTPGKCFSIHPWNRSSVSCDSHNRVLDIPRVAYCYSHATELCMLLISTLRLQNSCTLLPSRPRREKSCKLRLLHSGYRYPEYCECLLPGCTTLVKCFSPHTEYRTSLNCICLHPAYRTPVSCFSQTQVIENLHIA